jgi:hypothetical protein
MLLKILMIPSQIPNALFTSLAVAIAMIIILFFLPAIIELKKPKDAGPRIIDDNPAKITLGMLKIPIIDIEERQKLTYQSIIKNAAFLCIIPNIEF